MVIAETQTGWNHLEAGRWADARAAFETAADKEESAEVLHGGKHSGAQHLDSAHTGRSTRQNGTLV